MNPLIENVSSLSINKGNYDFQPLLIPRKTKLTDESLKKKGFYNGKILVCTSYRKDGEKVIAECSDFNFFDLLLKRFDKKPFPFIVSTNGIIEIEKDYIILMKRDNKVYAYKNYWDFPAGLVPFFEDPLDRLTKRIYEEIGIEEKHLQANPSPIYIEIQKEPFGSYFAIYYSYKCSLSKDQAEALFKESKNSIKKTLVNKKLLPELFLRKLIPII